MRDGAPLIDVVGADLGVIARSRDYSLLALEKVKQALSRPSDASPLIVTLHGLPATFAQAFGFDLLATA